MNHQLAIYTPDIDDLITRHLAHCSCCHQDLDRVTDFSIYSAEEITEELAAVDGALYCDPCNHQECSDGIQWEVYEPARDTTETCPECGGETVVFGADGW